MANLPEALQVSLLVPQNIIRAPFTISIILHCVTKNFRTYMQESWLNSVYHLQRFRPSSPNNTIKSKLLLSKFKARYRCTVQRIQWVISWCRKIYLTINSPNSILVSFLWLAERIWGLTIKILVNQELNGRDFVCTLWELHFWKLGEIYSNWSNRTSSKTAQKLVY